MKRFNFLAIVLALSSLLISCVPTKQFKDLEANCNDRANKMLDQQRSIEEALNERNSSITSLKKEIRALAADSLRLATALSDITSEYNKLSKQYDAIIKENEYISSNLNSKSDKILEDYQELQHQLLEREDSLVARENALKKSKQLVAERNKQISELNDILEQRSNELQALKNDVISALINYSDQGINIEEKDGKIYVSMEEDLLFNSGSYTISAEGKNAISNLGKVLENNPDINISIEGHTDNVPYTGKGQLKDNWDLSVMRATSVVKILLENKNIAPTRLTACGHGEYLPITDNSTPASKAKNRRTEIILTPDIQKLLEMLKKY
ncbi:MAG: OmpA family protein [Bacteroidales bacterium]|nr:OmpA family protein [Bacteroidales bacterium]